MTYLDWLIWLGYSLLTLAVMLRVLMDNKQPAQTLAWIMVLWVLPVIGIVLYIFFGQNTRKEKYISQSSLDQLTKRSMTEFVEQKKLQLPEHYLPIMQLFKNQDMALPFKDNDVEIFTDGYSFFPRLLREISRARHHIHIAIYIFEDDALGNLVADALIDKARQGVEVRLIYDDVGCWKVSGRFFERMRREGIDVHSFMPVKFPAFTSKVNYRNHRKLIIIDGQWGIIGGMNIATRYVRGTGEQPWRDTQLLIHGQAVYGLQRAFLVDWYFVDQTLISNRRYYPEPSPSLSNDCVAQVVTSSPVSPNPSIMQGYVSILLNARKYVYMESPYFLPTEQIMFAMRTAAEAGVDVRLMIPMTGDSKIVWWASLSYVQQTLEAGVKVYLYKAGFNHSKLLVSDDEVCSCGSCNVDFRSFEHDFECNIFFYDRAMALRMKQVFLDDEGQCQLLTDAEPFTSSTFWYRLWWSVLRLLSPLL